MYRLLIILLMFPFALNAQTYKVKGRVMNENGEVLPYATAVLLNPSDSTLEHYSITNEDGYFEISSVKKGNFLMQVAFLGNETWYKQVSIPLAKDDMGVLVLKTKSVNLDEVNIMEERIPIQIKNDTIEYNAGAFKVKPDAVAEDLLKKLPGVEVDRSGNIKAMGEDVSKVLVDGKEFFSSDPKIATKNLPAEALNKVQVFDKMSDESEFTGIDDGSRQKALNLVLKDDKKKGVFGDIEAAYGTGDHYKTGGKIYKFSAKSQMAAIGRLNNINEYGFSLNDYLSFNGGLSGLSAGGGEIVLGGDGGSFPINFGQAVTGRTTSGAGGLNLSFSKSKFNRVFMSYLVNGFDKKLDEEVKTWNYTPDGDYYQEELKNKRNKNLAHSFNFGLRNRIDSTQNLIFNANASFSDGSSPLNTSMQSYMNKVIINSLLLENEAKNDKLSGNMDASYQIRLNDHKSVLKLGASMNVLKTNTENHTLSDATYYSPAQNKYTDQFSNSKSEKLKYSARVSYLMKISSSFYIAPKVSFGRTSEELKYTQGTYQPEEFVIDSISPKINRQDLNIKPVLGMNFYTAKSKYFLNLGMEILNLENSINDDNSISNDLIYPMTSFYFESDYQTGRRVSLYYRSSVNTPSASQLNPIADNTDPFMLFFGNRNLKPEYAHNFHFYWMLFDQFSFTSVMFGANAQYTKDKIAWSRTVNEFLEQRAEMINVDDDFNIAGNIDFSTPVKKLGLKLNLKLNESYNRGISIINGVNNNTNSNTHKASLRFDNRKKDKWDVMIGGSFSHTTTKYSLEESLNNKYYQMSVFGELRFNLSDKWNFMLTADFTGYYSEGFDQQFDVPLLGAEISYYLLKNNRGVLTLKAFDLLNENTGIEQIAEMNYLREIRTDVIQRYVMLNFKYRLNKVIEKKGGFHIEIDDR